jgi:folate-dependent phosphoribosylglycinamide formyltransferase PurN
VGWFSTGRGPGSRALLTAAVEAIRRGELHAEIPFMFCNRERGQDPNTDQFLDLAEGYGLTVITRSDRNFRKAAAGAVARMGQALPAWRSAYDAAMLEAIAPYPFDVGMLAGYMLILWPDTTLAHPFLNLHPAAPGGPKGIWQEVIWRLIVERADESGIFLHVATPELDEGPIVAYCRYPIQDEAMASLWTALSGRSVEQIRAAEGEENALFKEIRRRGAAREIPLIVRTLAALADGRVRLVPGRVLTAEGHPALPLDLSIEVKTATRERDTA